MNYRKAYISIINHAKKEVRAGKRPENVSLKRRKQFSGLYFEFHHILPKSLFPLWHNRQSNIVPLTAREHYLCHLFLNKIYPNSNMFEALWILINDGQNNYIVKGSKEYEKRKKEYALRKSQNRGYKRSKELCEKVSEGLRRAHQDPNKYVGVKGSHRSEEAKRKMSQAHMGIEPWIKGKHLSEETKEKMRKAARGRKPTKEQKENRAKTILAKKQAYLEYKKTTNSDIKYFEFVRLQKAGLA